MADSQCSRMNVKSGSPKVWHAVGAFAILNSLILLPFVILQLGAGFEDAGLAAENSRGGLGLALNMIRRPVEDLFRISLEVVLLCTLLPALLALRFTRPVSARWLAVLFFALLSYELYDVVSLLLFSRAPIFSQDVTHAVDVAYLVRDGLTFWRFLALTAAVLGALAMFRWVILLFDRLIQVAQNHRLSFRVVVPACVGVLFVALGSIYGFASRELQVRSTLAKVGKNVSESIESTRALKSIGDGPVDSLYTTYSAQPPVDYPNLYLIAIESFGAVLESDESLRSSYDSLMSRFENQLNENGFQMARGHSTAPIKGGKSKFSIATLMSGINIDSPALFQLWSEKAPTSPHLVNVLNNWGYQTTALQPPNRSRPGLPLTNMYGFDRTVYYADLGYEGPRYGLWDIPDEYSLQWVQRNVLARSPGPAFLFFETASTHAPWSDLPPYFGDEIDILAIRKPSDGGSPKGVFDQLRDSFRNRYGLLRESSGSQYIDSIAYTFRNLADFISHSVSSGSIVVILGDHQPPILRSPTSDTPILIISGDDKVIDYASSVFDAETNLRHEGVFSLIVNLVRQRDASFDQSLLRPQGIGRSVLAMDRYAHR